MSCAARLYRMERNSFCSRRRKRKISSPVTHTVVGSLGQYEHWYTGAPVALDTGAVCGART